jgi:hypothetical protein
MRAIEFKTRIKNNQIRIPVRVRSEIKINPDKNVRVILFIDDTEVYDKLVFKSVAAEEFLNGYAPSDSVYDKC